MGQSEELIPLFWNSRNRSLSYRELESILLSADIPQDLPQDLASFVRILVDLVRGQSVDLGQKEETSNIRESLQSVDIGLPQSWKGTIILRTSGTTGVPKKQSHSMDSLLNNLRMDSSLQGSVWGLTWPVQHLAGLLVLFQALVSQATVIPLRGKSPTEQVRIIRENKVTHLSATPTFYRLLLAEPFPHLESIEQCTLGGEPSNEDLIEQLQIRCPRARTSNIYALSEGGSLLRSDSIWFTIQANLKSKLRVDENHLFLKRKNEWWDTGDRVQFHPTEEGKFRFVGRESIAINTGGYTVYPEDVEQALCKLSGIQEARVHGVASPIVGAIIAAELVGKEWQLPELRKALKDLLPSHAIPRKIDWVDSIIKTETGKIAR